MATVYPTNSESVQNDLTPQSRAFIVYVYSNKSYYYHEIQRYGDYSDLVRFLNSRGSTKNDRYRINMYIDFVGMNRIEWIYREPGERADPDQAYYWQFVPVYEQKVGV